MQTHDAVTIYDLLLGTVKDPREAIQTTGFEGLDVIPANIDLSAAEVHLVNEVAREQILASVLRKVSADYDVILIDCQPSLGLLTVNALTASHGVLIPLECEFFALRGVALLVETIEKVKDRLNPGLALDGILATMYDSRTLHSREVLQRVVEAFDDSVLETVIGRTVKFPDASVAGKPIIQFAPEHPAALAYRKVRGSSSRVAPSRRGAPLAERELAVDADASAAVRADPERAFRVSIGNFEGPFDLLLSLIGSHEMDITEVSLSLVTNEFIAHIRGLDGPEDLDEASSFLVVAATLLDLKLVGLLPQGELVDAEDVALLEARDLLFARLLQYRAFKQAASWFQERLAAESGRAFRDVPLEERFRAQVPELVWTTSPADLAAIALLALAPREIPTVGLDHLHAPLVSIREQAAVVVARLRGGAPVTFRELVADAGVTGVVIARFLAVLELYRVAAIEFDQPEALGELTLTWTAESWTDDALASLGAGYDS
ncbi:Sporulation initiation inhibitor protein Soj [Clavibacter michiganensis subsp. michiganensis]|uniref:Sporulation initiation inhibitor protein Soj n=1 Tax=Clavibacter michiganensis subsp. michiganensis TaxID=33013 RepID=A0A251XHF5_CLAMM|nr:Sporulation initiation inhibitor protein Soj [Clavibacter michiganensis subsp. michiganensis]OUE02449.1 Sporulation initiation inhibitor protein Soj [Clavibacter michiganensis subsp. michiganensis]